MVIDNFYQNWLKNNCLKKDCFPEVLSDEIKDKIINLCHCDTRSINDAFTELFAKTIRIDDKTGEKIALFSDKELCGGWEHFRGKNETTLEYFKRYSKFYLKEDTSICWRVEATDAISMPGILEINAVEYYVNEFEDDQEEVETIIGENLVEEETTENKEISLEKFNGLFAGNYEVVFDGNNTDLIIGLIPEPGISTQETDVEEENVSGETKVDAETSIEDIVAE